MGKLSIISAQLDFLVGDVEGNAERIIQEAKSAKKKKADLIIFPELALTGYPPEDLIFRHELYERIDQAFEKIKAETKGIGVILGYPYQQDGRYYNKAAFIHNGKLITSYAKQRLPNYAVFDEQRYFSPGSGACIVTLQDISIGIIICEDTWFPEPAQLAKQAGAQVIVSLNASPFTYDKSDIRESIVKQRAQEIQLPIIYVNLVGAQDELVFDGGSMVLDETGRICQQAPYFEECLLHTELTLTNHLSVPIKSLPKPLNMIEKIYKTLVLGLTDYANKNGFKKVLIGLSGGIDSALTLIIAVDALGADRVEGLLMPSRFTAELSNTEALKQTTLLGVKTYTLPIEESFSLFLKELSPFFKEKPHDLTEQNLQARIRGLFLMALSNKFGHLVVPTSNKSESAVGYTTLYGDMVGGLSLLKDVYKTLVYELADYRNSLSPTIPQSIIDRPPSAELAKNQKDVDSLPPYSVLDKILQLYIEKDKSPAEIAAFIEEPLSLIQDIVKKIQRNEYKRRQSAPGIRITARAFGKDRRYPITSGF
ncbi:MAG TPA: NAD+ synthase [Coxiellaceae bacterium]|nr:NAD+ synthase [Coxiellaceae bacterium]